MEAGLPGGLVSVPLTPLMATLVRRLVPVPILLLLAVVLPVLALLHNLALLLGVQ